jgi:uncharacterized OB-fold protein
MCGAVYVPPMDRCIKCRNLTSSYEVNEHGELTTYTILHSPPEGFKAPLILGIVTLTGIENDNSPKAGAKTNLLCEGRIDESDLEMGMKVKITTTDEKYYFNKC